MIAVKRAIMLFILITQLVYIDLTFAVLQQTLSISLFPINLKGELYVTE